MSHRPRRIVAAPLILTVLLAFGAVAEATEHAVTIGKDGVSFEPGFLLIEVGDTVTWTNDGGFHNVDAADGSFTSGPPSTDLWTLSVTFHEGGVYDYHCDIHVDLGMAGTIEVVGIFGDSLESGDTAAWSVTEGERETCTCYFSSDCVGGSFCNYGPGGFTTEDICTWVDGKPNGDPETGCDLPREGPSTNRG